MYTNPFNRKHSTIRQVLDRFLEPARLRPIRRSESVTSSSSGGSKGSTGSLNMSCRASTSSHDGRGILQWGRK
ncbi:hypothetical protein TKK_0005931 [Trichogramma kaykai]|uniref:Uncharacterized protein n=1 Tax=Trichogramma kaykai TaxID=54128 RepID=A0ABD2XGI7_9HYME